ncbi:cucumisin [Quercus suber]|uniref:Cucumisin n=1 Tax=Quercus suber TaxID=58331 RepID=A0AAW0JX64_QUESU
MFKMAGQTSSLSMLLLLCFASTLLIAHSTSQNDKKAYIVYMGNKRDEISTSSLYTSMLQDVVGSHIGAESLLYSYKRSFHGFAVELTEQEAQKMAGMDGVVSVFPNQKKSSIQQGHGTSLAFRSKWINQQLKAMPS